MASLEFEFSEMSKTRFIGKCIYCGSSTPPLSDEHTVPYGLNGDSVLRSASCQECADITSAFETIVLRETLFAARAAMGAKTRRRKQRERQHSMYIVVDGQEQKIEAPWQDHWKVIPLPVFEPPAFLDGRVYKAGVEAHSMDIAWVGESPQEIAKLHNAEDVVFKMRSGLRVATAFAKLVAKIAYSSAVMEFGLSGIQEAFIVPAILGKRDDLGRWVGCDRQRIMGTKYNLWHTKLEIFRGLILARVKLFARSDGTEYVVVVGRIRDATRGLLHSLGRTDA
jgi:hypothetical protein